MGSVSPIATTKRGLLFLDPVLLFGKRGEHCIAMKAPQPSEKRVLNIENIKEQRNNLNKLSSEEPSIYNDNTSPVFKGNTANESESLRPYWQTITASSCNAFFCSHPLLIIAGS